MALPIKPTLYIDLQSVKPSGRCPRCGEVVA